MAKSNFIHLHVHTEYSLLDSTCRIAQLIKKAKDFDMPALAITDHGNMSGAIEFYREAKKAGIKPIIGCEVYVTREHGYHLLLLARDNTGYLNLMRLVSKGQLAKDKGLPFISKKELSEHAQGLIGLSGCMKGEVPSLLLKDNYPSALKAAGELFQIFGKDNFYIELMDQGLMEQKKVNEALVKIATELEIKTVVTNDVHYLNHDQAYAHEVLLCIQTQTTLNVPNRMRFGSDQFYFKNQQEMAAHFSWSPEALASTVEIADRINVELDFSQYHLPQYETPQGYDAQSFLRNLCEGFLEYRYGENIPIEFSQRLEHELAVIKSMGFDNYFLIVWDLISYAKNRGIPVGPGRGTVSGSLVAYLLGITEVDPIKYGLLFERFINPGRKNIPDIDIDFCYKRRGKIIKYITKEYGADNVAQIATFGSMYARAVVRDVGRVMCMSSPDVDRIVELIPNEIDITIEQALNMEPQLRQAAEADKTIKKLLATAQVLEGLNRHVSIHAAGIVISDRPLTEYVPLFKSSDGQVSTAFDMDGISQMGLLKMDFLGLRTLTIIDKIILLIKRYQGIDIDIDALALDDKNTYEMLTQGDTAGVFLLESKEMGDVLKKIKPSQFEDLSAILALYRPGPMRLGQLDDFIKRKCGKQEIPYPHPKLKEVLESTYGIILYQEQIMQIISIIAGFSMAQADDLRKVLMCKETTPKSKANKMRSAFIEGCAKTHQIPERQANQLFDLLDFLAGYTFNKAHAVAYALITYRTAYLKANFPIEFMTAVKTKGAL